MTAKLECVHADTCLPDYWGGHHLPNIAVPVYKGMHLKDLKDQLHRELDSGAVAGNDPVTRDDSGEAGDRWYKHAHAAINRIRPGKKGHRKLFNNLDETPEDDADCYESVYAYFVFTSEDRWA